MKLRFEVWGLALFAAFAVSVIGCGGGGGANSPGGAAGPSGGSQTANVGMAQITYTGKPKPMLVETSGQVSFYGEAGASYSALTIYPTPNLASTNLLYTRNLNSGDEVYYAPAQGTGTPTLLTHDNANGYCTVSKSGVVCYATITNNTYEIVTSYLDGSKSKVVLSGVPAEPAISPNGATIAYVTLSGDVYTVPSAGGTPTEIYNGGNAYTSMPVWSPSGTQIAFSAPDSTDTYTDLYTIAVTGGATTNQTPSALKGILVGYSWSPDGNSIACTYATNASSPTEVIALTVTGGVPIVLTPTGYNDTAPSYSPDGGHMAFYRSNVGGATPGIYVSDTAGSNAQLVVPEPSSASQGGPIIDMFWTYYQPNEKFVGSGSSLSDANVSGLLLTQNGSQFASLMVFGAATPSTATLTTEAVGANGGPSIFKLTANTINIISYTNIYIGAPTFLSLSGTTAALVSLDGATGLIDMVAPGEFSNKQPMTTSAGRSTLVYNGKFSGIYDGTGKNLAPMGAKTLQIDAKSGKLISYQ